MHHQRLFINVQITYVHFVQSDTIFVVKYHNKLYVSKSV